MAVKLAWNELKQFADGTGVPYSGAKLFCYVAGSVNTKQTTYTESTGTTPNTNPIVLDSNGRTPQPVWLTTGLSYKFVLAPSTDTDPPASPISGGTIDNCTGINDSSTVVNEWVAGPTPTFVSTTSFTLVGDQTSTFHVGRRLKFTVTAGTVYGTITISAFAALTTITVVLDSGVLDSGLSAVSYGIQSASNSSIPSVKLSAGAWTLQNTLAMSGAAINEAQGADIASAATVNLDTATGNTVDVTGVVTITAITLSQGRQRTVRFTGILTLTNGASLVLPGGANITTAAGDFAIFKGYAAGVVRCVVYMKASGKAVINTANTQPTKTVLTSGSGTYTTPTNATRLWVRVVAGGGGGQGIGAGSGAGAGADTTFSTITAKGGSAAGAAAGNGGAGGTGGSGGDFAIAGGAGGSGGAAANVPGGNGGNSAFGGGGVGGAGGNNNVAAGAATNSGAGGGGSSSSGAATSPGGGAGEYREAIILSPAATYSYGVGAAGTAGTGATTNGGAGGSGVIIVHEYYD